MYLLISGKASPMHSRTSRIWYKYLKENGYAYIDDGALVVDVKEESDTKEIPPCMILKSDGASLYTYDRPCDDRRANETVSSG